MLTVILLVLSNTFMTIAWYAHLKKPEWSMGKAIIISWGIALMEYCLMIPANRIGYKSFNAFQLKILQEAITLCVFLVFAVFYLKEKWQWNYLLGFVLIFLAVLVVFKR